MARRAERCAAAALLLAAAALHAEPVTVSPEQLRADIASMQALVRVCAERAAACDPGKVVADEAVAGEPGFAVHWDWLRSALKIAADPAKAAKPGEPVADRAKLLREAAAHLDTLAQQAGAPAAVADVAQASAVAADVLRGAEFQREVEPPTWWDRLQDRIYRWIGALFEGFSRLGAAAPWLGRLLEWLLFGGAAVVVLVLLFRNVQRQRRRAELGPALEATPWDREAGDWEQRASAFAGEGNWREAVRCLYWAAILLLEGRRAWRHNPTRTPREYVRLLPPGSARQRALRSLTQMFERVWYGLHAGDARQYADAQALYAELQHSAAEAA